jgi:uncharacterized DUF497 family protein
MATEIRFEWDARKAVFNKRKHGVSFELATLVFDDPRVYEFEEGNEHGEVRYRAIGEALGRLLFVSYTSFEKGGEEIVRIISARKAEPKEHRAYQRHTKDHR